jgi:hypothetical protein
VSVAIHVFKKGYPHRVNLVQEYGGILDANLHRIFIG